MSRTSPRVRVDSTGPAWVISLARPEAINAIDLGMIEALTAALEAARAASVTAVVLRGDGDRGFCAGGDVRGLFDQIRGGSPENAELFFRAEYHLNDTIATFPHPVVALADGITMGGGIGLAGHALLRVVTERSRLAMPETRIGLTPDVGGSWLLSHAPGRLGEYLALTGASMGAADAIDAGFADHVVPAAALDDLVAAIQSGQDAEAAVRARAGEAPAPALPAEREWIDQAFAAASVPEIIAALRERPEAGAAHAADTLEEVSPTAVTVTLAAVRSARDLPDLRAALAQEFGLVSWFVQTQPDLVEGIRAQLVDKDRSPRWSPATLDAVPAGLAAEALAFTPPRPLW